MSTSKRLNGKAFAQYDPPRVAGYNVLVRDTTQRGFGVRNWWARVPPTSDTADTFLGQPTFHVQVQEGVSLTGNGVTVVTPHICDAWFRNVAGQGKNSFACSILTPESSHVVVMGTLLVYVPLDQSAAPLLYRPPKVDLLVPASVVRTRFGTGGDK